MGRYWGCPSCGIRRDWSNGDGTPEGWCWRCHKQFDPKALQLVGLTGNQPLPFGETLNERTEMIQMLKARQDSLCWR